MAEMKEISAVKTAELHSEIVELKLKLEKVIESHRQEDKRYREEINILSNDLKEALESSEEAKRSMRFLQQELARSRSDFKKIEENIRSPLVRALIKILSFFFGSGKRSVS